MARLDVKVLDMVNGETKKIEFGGNVFTKTSEPARVDDVAMVVSPWGHQVEGAFYRVINEYHPYYDGDDSLVFISGELGVSSHDIERVNIFRKKKPKLEIGDIAVIRDDADEGRLEHGDIVRVVQHDYIMDFEVQRLADGKTEHFDNGELDKADKPVINKGDHVRIIVPENEDTHYARGSVTSNDEIGVVGSVDGTGEIGIYFPSYMGGKHEWIGKDYELEVVADDELTPHGNSINAGDIIRIVRYEGGAAEDTIAEVSRVEIGAIIYNDYSGDSPFNYFYSSPQGVELVTKFANRKDLGRPL